MVVYWGAAVEAGVIATAVMTALIYMGKGMGMKMDMPRMLGLMFTPPENSVMVYAMGLIAHFVMGIIFAVIYAVIFAALGLSGGWLWGLVFGAVHSVVVGIAMAMMPAMHPRMGEARALPLPGPFGINNGMRVPAGMVMLYLIYGALVGGLYPVLGG